MQMTEAARRFHTLSDVELIELLYTAGDRLPREAVDEVLSRRSRILPYLHGVVADKLAWTLPLPEWWAVVHATYCLGAMEDPDTLPALLTALRWADAFDCDWVTEDLPSIFGRLGPAVYEPLCAVAGDVTAGPGARSIALASVAAVALSAPYLIDEVLDAAAHILADAAESLYLRQTAANILMDLRSRAHRDLLLAFGREEAARKREDPEYHGVFFDWEVDELLDEKGGGRNVESYQRDWLVFYEPEEIARRQERWRRERDEGEREPEVHSPRRDIQAPCSCGSGRPFAHCCYLKVH